jgi:heme-degrading monooxygenase HmoA
MEPSGSIVRAWRARATEENAGHYVAFFERLRVGLAKLAGFRDALVMTRVEAPDLVEISVLTFWDSMDAVTAFASPDVERAVVEPEAQELLLSYDNIVRHYTIASR